MATLAEPSTGLTTFVRELADVNRVLRPVADALVSGLGSSADVFEAISRDPEALQDAIAESPATLRAGLRSFPVQRPFLRDLADISDELAGTAREIRAGAPTLSRALATGTEVLPTTPPFNRALRGSLEALRGLSASPTTNLTLGGLESTFDTLTPTLRYLGPHITVCNYWNSWWTLLADHISEQDATGTVQRIQVKQAPGQLGFFGATRPANGGEADPVTHAAQGDVPALHTQPYGRAVDEQGDADCESGQRGYPLRLAEGAPEGLNIAVDPRTPGSQGPTATGRPRVPDGQTFTAEPGGISPQVVK
jgi:hypothetical protein